MTIQYIPGPEGGMVPVESVTSLVDAMTPAARARAERRARWAEMAKQGLSGYDISSREGVCSAAVYKALRDMGLSARRLNGVHQRQRAVERAKQVNEIYQREGSLEAAGKVLGITRERVRQILVQGGIFTRVDLAARNAPTQEQIAAARYDFDHGLNLDAIAIKHGVSRGRVRDMLQLSGVDLQKNYGRRMRTFSYEECRARYEAGESVDALAAAYGKGYASICRAIAKAGGRLRGRVPKRAA